MSTPRHPDVLVIGAGPAGCATAIRLARAGTAVTLVDRARFPRDKVCAEYMSPETLRQLDLLGVLPAVEAAGGQALAGTTVVGPRGARFTGLFERAGHPPFRPTGLALRRLVLDHLLVRAAREAGVTVLEEHLVLELIVERGAVVGAVVRGPHGLQTIRARLTVGADGLRSLVARRIGRRHHGHPARIAFVAHVGGGTGLEDRAEMHVGDAGYAGLNPLGGGLTNVSLVVPRRRAAAAGGRVTEFFLEALRGLEGVGRRVPADGIRHPIRVTGPFSATSRRVIGDGALLVGDAADFFDPFTGEGICSALRGAALATDAALDALHHPGPVAAGRLREYVRARRQAFAGQWAVERLLGFGMGAPALFDRAVARLGRRDWGHTLIGVTGDFVPPAAVLNPRFLTGMLW